MVEFFTTNNVMDELEELDIFYFSFGLLRKVIKEVEPDMKYFLYPGIRWKREKQ
jgi:hypothetical protein